MLKKLKEKKLKCCIKKNIFGAQNLDAVDISSCQKRGELQIGVAGRVRNLPDAVVPLGIFPFSSQMFGQCTRLVVSTLTWHRINP